MNKQEVIDDFINRQRGIPNAVMFSIFGHEFDVDYFKKRARKLGWINGYKYGVEYETNGKKPDLPDDVLVDIKCEEGANRWQDNTNLKVSGVLWSRDEYDESSIPASHFKIIDQRYKPVEPAPEKSWHEKGGLPPVGAFVDVVGDVQYGAGESNCEVIAHVENCAVIRMSYGLGCFESHCLKPTKTERELLIDIIASAGNLSDGMLADAILAAGFKAPESKD